jgi:hypothetical protein
VSGALPISETARVFEGVARLCPSGKGSMCVKVSVERWWNDTDRGKQQYSLEKKSSPTAIYPSNM